MYYEGYEDYVGPRTLVIVENTIKEARGRGFGAVYTNHKKKIKIFACNQSGSGKYVGTVYWIPKVRNGFAMGPAYVNAEGKKYLLDEDGALFDYKTGKIIPLQRMNRRV